MKLAIIWITILISIAFLVHPRITLEVHDGERWVGGGTYGDWLWNVPDAVTGVRYATSFAHSIVYCIATLLLAGGVWVTLQRTSPRSPLPQNTAAAVIPPHVTSTPPVNKRSRLFEPYMYVMAFVAALLLFFLRECRKIETRKELQRQQQQREEQLKQTLDDALRRSSTFPIK